MFSALNAKYADAVFCAKTLKAAGLDYVDVSSGGISSEARNPTTPGYNVPIAEQVRQDLQPDGG